MYGQYQNQPVYVNSVPGYCINIAHGSLMSGSLSKKLRIMIIRKLQPLSFQTYIQIVEIQCKSVSAIQITDPTLIHYSCTIARHVSPYGPVLYQNCTPYEHWRSMDLTAFSQLLATDAAHARLHT